MTPSGCATGTPGRVLTGGATILTWKLDLDPFTTFAPSWRGRVRPAVPGGTPVSNTASILALGRSGVVGGTGHAQVVKSATSLIASCAAPSAPSPVTALGYNQQVLVNWAPAA